MAKIPYVTTPIYYANAEPHVGHLYTTLIANTWRNVSKLLKKDAFYTSGLDEHGQKVAHAAKIEGYYPQDFVDNLSIKWIDFFDDYGIKFDKWVRTSKQEHKDAAKHFWSKIKDKGYIYKGIYSGWYSVRDESYYSKNDLVDGKAPTGADVVWMEEECYFFKLSAFQEPLEKFYKENPGFIFPKKRLNEAVGFLKKGLKDFAISRSKKKMYWGIEVPDDPEHVMYVWIDALTSYLSGIGYPDKSYKTYWPAIHLIGKDILKFHAIYWPALLMAAGIELPKKIIAHGWWLKDEEKISKSLGNATSLKDLDAEYTKDGIKYFLLRGVSIGEDGQFKDEVIRPVVFSELSNSFGNFFLRVLGIIEKTRESIIPPKRPIIKEYRKVLSIIDDLKANLLNVYNSPHLIGEYIEKFNNCVKALNLFIEEKKAWEKEVNKTPDMTFFLLEALRKISILAFPILPEASKKIMNYFSYEPTLDYYDVQFKEEMLKFIRPVLFPK